MRQTPPEVIAVNLAFVVFWLLLVAMIWIVGGRWEGTRAFRERMIAQWKPALAVTAIYLISYVLSGRGFISPSTPAIFCQVLIGLAVARGIAGYEPLQTTQSILRRERIVRNIVLLIVIGIIAGIVGLLIGSAGIGVAQSIFHETNRTSEVAQSLSIDKVQAFFLFLWGAGISEETTYRLVALSFVWAMTRRRWLAIFIAALLFAAYHLSPLNAMYVKFWQFPISQFLAATFDGILWGYVFTKRDYETAILSHTMSDWIAVLLLT